MNDNVIPVYVLSGFLGSGKTTLLNLLLDDAKERGWKPAVLMNEVGDIHIEGAVAREDVPMTELLGGCICCSSRGDLGLELVKLAQEHQPDVIWIESTGIAQPFEIMDSVTEASLYAKIELRGVITVVDARHLLDRLRIGSGKTFKLMKEQIRVASHLVLNKIDLVREEELGEVEAALSDWNAHAKLAATVKSRIEPDWVYADWTNPNTNELAIRSACNNDDPDHEHDDSCASAPYSPHAHHHAHEENEAHDHVNAVTHYLPGAADSHAFEAFLKRLPDGVYRAKGIVRFHDTANRYLFQYAYKETDFLPITPQKTVHDVAVFIGEGFSKTELRKQLDDLFEAQD
ncbi:CobW family GTP-binding protein [Cohnella faecalis]|uniref:GTP-binding protein n=1 Tax=Cohnella faecalis TaxID=2315694 RepID=A0A398CQN5_9BACL|nr:GTP-binding protein [Cohnella faecalis]RIE04812.1 GTP-binding protein [Cohnella faecalis]